MITFSAEQKQDHETQVPEEASQIVSMDSQEAMDLETPCFSKTGVMDGTENRVD